MNFSWVTSKIRGSFVSELLRASWHSGGVYSSYSLATDLKSQMTFGLGCHIGWIHEWKKIIVEILKMMTSCLDKSAVGLGCLTGYFSGMD